MSATWDANADERSYQAEANAELPLGPWQASIGSANGHVWADVLDAHGDIIADCNWSPDEHYWPVARNQRLARAIAALPTLIDACWEVLEIIEPVAMTAQANGSRWVNLDVLMQVIERLQVGMAALEGGTEQ